MMKLRQIEGMVRIGLLLAALPLSGCMAAVGVNSRSIPPDAAQTCDRHCQTIGMRLSAVAIMADNVGCVCQGAWQPRASADAAGQLATPPGGITAIAAEQAAVAAAALQQQMLRQQMMQAQQMRY
jgi:hypothetical protein